LRDPQFEHDMAGSACQLIAFCYGHTWPVSRFSVTATTPGLNGEKIRAGSPSPNFQDLTVNLFRAPWSKRLAPRPLPRQYREPGSASLEPKSACWVSEAENRGAHVDQLRGFLLPLANHPIFAQPLSYLPRREPFCQMLLRKSEHGRPRHTPGVGDKDESAIPWVV